MLANKPVPLVFRILQHEAQTIIQMAPVIATGLVAGVTELGRRVAVKLGLQSEEKTNPEVPLNTGIPPLLQGGLGAEPSVPPGPPPPEPPGDGGEPDGDEPDEPGEPEEKGNPALGALDFVPAPSSINVVQKRLEQPIYTTPLGLPKKEEQKSNRILLVAAGLGGLSFWQYHRTKKRKFSSRKNFSRPKRSRAARTQNATFEAETTE